MMDANKINRRDWLKGLGLTGAALAAGTAAAQDDVAAAALPEVPTKTLGATGAEIPILLMGGSQAFDAKYDRRLHRAFEHGITYIDTSETYSNGQSHKTLAPFIHQVGRKNIWVTSKAKLSSRHASPAKYMRRLEAIFPELETDYLDMFFMHGLDDVSQLDPKFIKMGDEVRQRGLAKHFGFSCHDRDMIAIMNKAADIGAPGIDCIQFRYNFAYYGDDELNRAMDRCKEAGIGLIAMKTMGSVPEDSEEVRRFESNNFSLPQAKLKAVWADDRIDAAVSEMANIMQVQENADAARSTKQLSLREYRELTEYAARTAHHRCLGCAHNCERQVARDVNIADSLRYLMYAECYGKPEEARNLYRAITPAQRQLTEAEAQAATAACPQGINIAERLKQADRLLA